MKTRIENLIKSLDEYLTSDNTLPEIEELYVTPILIDDLHDHFPRYVNEAIYALDMWEVNNLTQQDVNDIRLLLKKYLDDF